MQAQHYLYIIGYYQCQDQAYQCNLLCSFSFLLHRQYVSRLCCQFNRHEHSHSIHPNNYNCYCIIKPRKIHCFCCKTDTTDPSVVLAMPGHQYGETVFASLLCLSPLVLLSPVAHSTLASFCHTSQCSVVFIQYLCHCSMF